MLKVWYQDDGTWAVEHLGAGPGPSEAGHWGMPLKGLLGFWSLLSVLFSHHHMNSLLFYVLLPWWNMVPQAQSRRTKCHGLTPLKQGNQINLSSFWCDYTPYLVTVMPGWHMAHLFVILTLFTNSTTEVTILRVFWVSWCSCKLISFSWITCFFCCHLFCSWPFPFAL